jgi:hypothetical protein
LGTLPESVPRPDHDHEAVRRGIHPSETGGITATSSSFTPTSVRLHRIADSCGYGVPFTSFEGHRPTMDQWSTRKGPEAIRNYWSEKNAVSIDAIEGLTLN